jgi:hypothetical protein
LLTQSKRTVVVLYRRETGPTTLKEELSRLRIFDIKDEGKMYGSKWVKLQEAGENCARRGMLWSLH